MIREKIEREFRGLLKKDLFGLALESGIPGCRRMRKSELSEALILARILEKSRSSPEVLNSLSRKELVGLCKTAGIRPASRTRKAELVEALRSYGSSLSSSRPLPSPNRRPESRGPTRVIALVIDPYTLHVYWEIPERDLEMLRAEPPGRHGRPVLRFCDVTGPAGEADVRKAFDIEIDLRTRRWNVPLWSPGKSYTVELGIKTWDDRFLLLARSNVVELPRGEPAITPNEIPVPAVKIDQRSFGPLKTEGPPGHLKEEVSRQERLPDHVPETEPGHPYPGDRGASGAQKSISRESPGEDLVRRTEERFARGISSPQSAREGAPEIS